MSTPPLVSNIHERTLPVGPDVVRELLATYGGSADRIWPAQRWPAARLDRGVAVGSVGGHGPIRYVVTQVTPDLVRCRFTGPPGVEGDHTFEVIPVAPDRTIVRHTIAARMTGRMVLAWPLAIRWLHDALLNDLMDGLVATATGQPQRLGPLPVWAGLVKRAGQVLPRLSAPGTRAPAV